VVNALIDSARSAGFEKMMIESGTYLQEAQKLYESLGFDYVEHYDDAECGTIACDQLYYMGKKL